MSNLTTKVANWLPRPGKAKVTYAEGSSFEGVFNGERIKEGSGKYTWMKPAEEDGEEPQVCSRLRTYARAARLRVIAPACAAGVALLVVLSQYWWRLATCWVVVMV